MGMQRVQQKVFPPHTGPISAGHTAGRWAPPPGLGYQLSGSLPSSENLGSGSCLPSPTSISSTHVDHGSILLSQRAPAMPEHRSVKKQAARPIGSMFHWEISRGNQQLGTCLVSPFHHRQLCPLVFQSQDTRSTFYTWAAQCKKHSVALTFSLHLQLLLTPSTLHHIPSHANRFVHENSYAWK